jgi:hypothetical protein
LITGLIWWGGGTLASLQSATDRLTSALTETREMIMVERASSAQLEARVRGTGKQRKPPHSRPLQGLVEES